MKLPRRNFLALSTAALAEPVAGMSANTGSRLLASDSPGPALKLAGMSLVELRKRYQVELFEAYLPFWDRYGIDHKYGGFMCALDQDGTLVNDSKFHWFQGRGIWVYSFLYNHFDKNPH